MTSTNGSEPVEPDKAPRKRAPRKASTSTDPEVLAAEIERTREDLAETLDAIAEKVSPKRVADRTRKKVADKVSDVTGQAKEAAASAKDKVVEQAGHAKEAAVSAGASAKDAAVSAKDAATGASARSGGGSTRIEGTGAATAVPASPPVEALPPVTAVQADGLDLSTAPVSTDTVPEEAAPTTSPTASPTASPTTFPTAPAAPYPGTAGPAVKPELVAGGVLGLLVLLLLRRRRRKARTTALVRTRPSRSRRRR